MENPLVSIIIPSHNRFEGLLIALKSIKKQSFTDYEVIIINDGSDDERYQTYHFDKNFKVLHLEKNSVVEKGYFSDSIRNHGINKATGKYIAFLDDDDYWFSNKLELQIDKLETSELKMTCSEATSNYGFYDENSQNKLFNDQIVFKEISKIYKNSSMKREFQKKGLYNFQYPSIWTSKFIKIHNCIITSSVVVEKNLLDKIGNFRDIQSKKLWADWDCWLGLLTHTDSYYFSDPLLYYNLSDGLNSKQQ
ncbi:glycosyltransferase family 2 protein [Acidimicrobiia bacterium]|nr:glycosyltransferase family 2 protein [Acidimicrobiia bacterium]